MNLFERIYGYEYTKYEFKCIKKIYSDKLYRSSILSGYLTPFYEWYILRPTFTTINPYIICKSQLDIPASNVKVYGIWQYDTLYESLIFNIERYETIDIEYEYIFEDIIDYAQYVDILFSNSILSDNLKNFLAHIILSIDPGARITIKNSNAIKLMDRLLRFIPLESICINKIFIKELRHSLLIRPRLSINLEVREDYNELDTIYNDKIDEFNLYQAFKFIVSIYIAKVRFDHNDIDYITHNVDYKTFDINTIISLSISNAKINKQRRLEKHNILYITNLLEDTLLVKL